MPGVLWERTPQAGSIRVVDEIVRVWIDDPNPIFRMGLVSCLKERGFALAGESSGFVPEPDLDRLDILVFDLGEQNLGWALGEAKRRPARLLGLVSGGGPQWDATRGLCTVVVRSELTGASFLACLRSLSDLSRSPVALPGVPGAPGHRGLPHGLWGTGLSREDREVLRLLAEGQDTRGIAAGLGFSRRAARGAVNHLLSRMGARSTAEAVARALREGAI